MLRKLVTVGNTCGVLQVLSQMVADLQSSFFYRISKTASAKNKIKPAVGIYNPYKHGYGFAIRLTNPRLSGFIIPINMVTDSKSTLPTPLQ
jgi:hypothetical protein